MIEVFINSIKKSVKEQLLEMYRTGEWQDCQAQYSTHIISELIRGYVASLTNEEIVKVLDMDLEDKYRSFFEQESYRRLKMYNHIF